MILSGNPELIRNVRAQLRRGRMLAAALICGALSLVIGYALASTMGPPSRPPGEWARTLLNLTITGQTIVLSLGGGIACLHAIHREKDLNTFDFQRVTRLTPLELTMGKLLGAPALAYFIAFCLIPAAGVGAALGGVDVSSLLAAYVVLILGSIAFHAFALVISLVVERTGATVAVVFFLMLVSFSSTPVSPLFHLGELTPFVANNVANQATWHLQPASIGQRFPSGESSMTDAFFGWPVHHVLVLIVLYTTFAAWFLLAVVRNIKRDPTVYELLRPPQALGLALYANLLLIGFFRWSIDTALIGQAIVLSVSTMLFWWLGLVLLRNRDRLRRIQAAGARMGWSTAVWPAPYLLAGFLAAGLATVAYAQARSAAGGPWDIGLGVFRVAILSLWLVRDILYLQWMMLRRGRRSLISGILYLLVFYVCVTILIGTLHLVETAWGLGLSVTLIPPAALGVDVQKWVDNRGILLLALGIQVAAAAFLATLNARRIPELSPSRPAPALPAS